MQRAALAAKFKTGKVIHTNKSADYLWQVCNMAEFKPYISNNPSGKNAAVARMRKEFLRYEQGLSLNGARQGMCLLFLAYNICLLIPLTYIAFPITRISARRQRES
jgi:hypothetical protein